MMLGSTARLLESASDPSRNLGVRRSATTNALSALNAHSPRHPGESLEEVSGMIFRLVEVPDRGLSAETSERQIAWICRAAHNLQHQIASRWVEHQLRRRWEKRLRLPAKQLHPFDRFEVRARVQRLVERCQPKASG